MRMCIYIYIYREREREGDIDVAIIYHYSYHKTRTQHKAYIAVLAWARYAAATSGGQCLGGPPGYLFPLCRFWRYRLR